MHGVMGTKTAWGDGDRQRQLGVKGTKTAWGDWDRQRQLGVKGTKTAWGDWDRQRQHGVMGTGKYCMEERHWRRSRYWPGNSCAAIADPNTVFPQSLLLRICARFPYQECTILSFGFFFFFKESNSYLGCTNDSSWQSFH